MKRMHGKTRGCLRYLQIEAGLFKLARIDLDAVALNFSRVGEWKINIETLYKFEQVPDYMHRAPWPFVSQEGLESIAIFTYHGKNTVVSKVWSSDDVQTGDVIAVHGLHVSQQFWRLKHPKIRVRFIVLIETEGEDVTSGVYHVMDSDD